MKDGLLPVLGISLGLTLLIEEVFAFITGIRSGKDLGLVFLVNLLTNPAAVMCYYYVASSGNLNNFVIKITIEIIVILVEGFYFKKYSFSIKNPFLFSAFANVLSFGTGLIANAIL